MEFVLNVPLNLICGKTYIIYSALIVAQQLGQSPIISFLSKVKIKTRNTYNTKTQVLDAAAFVLSKN